MDEMHDAARRRAAEGKPVTLRHMYPFMDEPILLTLPTPSFDALVEAVHKARKGTTTVRVDVQALEALVVDHGRLLRATPHKEPE